MKRGDLDDLAAFAMVARERSFAAAAPRLGLSASALSHAIKGLEDRLGIPLLARTTRSVATTAAGERLLWTLQPSLDAITAELAALEALRDKPAGPLRITTFKHAASAVLMPVIPDYARRYPEVTLEITVAEQKADLIDGRFDAGIRFGESVARDMIGVQVWPAFSNALVAAPAYLAAHGTPTSPDALRAHRCLVHRVNDEDGRYVWPFRSGVRSVPVRIAAALVFNDVDLLLQAAIAGQGIACLVEDLVAAPLARGELVELLPGRSPRWPGYWLYYPSRRQRSPALAALIALLQARLRLLAATG